MQRDERQTFLLTVGAPLAGVHDPTAIGGVPELSFILNTT